MKHYLSIATSINNEAINLKEWIEYHLFVGVDHFYLYDNQSTDNTKEVLTPYIESGLVDYCFYDDKNREYLWAIKNAVEKSKDETFWLAHVNADEFIVAPEGEKISEVLKNYEEYSGIGINWLFFGSSGRDKRPTGYVVENYLKRSSEDFEPNKHIKSIVNPRKVQSVNHPHFFSFKEGFLVDENKQKIKDNWAWAEKYSGKILRLHHYFCKSKEDWQEKIIRGNNDIVKTTYPMEKFEGHDRNEILDLIMLRVWRYKQKYEKEKRKN